MSMADHKSLKFQRKSQDYREKINMVLRRSDLRDAFIDSEVLALDGSEDKENILVHFNVIFDPYKGLVSTPDLMAIFSEEIQSKHKFLFKNMDVDQDSLTVKEVTGIIEEPIVSSSPLGKVEDLETTVTTTPPPPRKCENLKLPYCRAIGYNVTTYPNFLGHTSFEDVQDDVIAFREIVDSECFREAFDFVCRLLQPPCESRGYLEPAPGLVCREYCQQFMKGCGTRLLPRFKKYFDCELFPESTGVQSCRSKPKCSQDLQKNSLSPRLCDGVADCPDLSDERTCSFCSIDSMYCGRGRACVPKTSRCDGKADCPDGADEKDCLSIAPLAANLINAEPLVPYLPQFHSEGFAVFSEKGLVGKLCAEGLEGDFKSVVRQTVAESLCKSLGYDSVKIFDVRNDTEGVTDYVRVLDPHAAEISFIRTSCTRRQVLYVKCGELQCGVQSVLTPTQNSLPKQAAPGDWPWLVALFREDSHVCDGTLISSDWVLTTESCFQGQPRATWIAIFGTVRLSSSAPWTQRRRIIGMVKSPVEGSTAALIRLESPIVFSDFIRPVCLPDDLTRKLQLANDAKVIQTHNFAVAEKLSGDKNLVTSFKSPQRAKPSETSEFFNSPLLIQEGRMQRHQWGTDEKGDAEYDGVYDLPKAEAISQHYPSYIIPDSSVQFYPSFDGNVIVNPSLKPFLPTPPSLPLGPKTEEEIWTNCNTLGWSRTRDALQRVQLKIGDMAACENISIATVNSMCTEATYQKNDCTQEEFSGAPVQCLLPGTNQWALVGVSSWRIACGSSGVERPRMYDKIASNTAWIRETIASGI
ncbi:hypothetical protein ACFFRR_001360 [Megaselia abdita]